MVISLAWQILEYAMPDLWVLFLRDLVIISVRICDCRAPVKKVTYLNNVDTVRNIEKDLDIDNTDCQLPSFGECSKSEDSVDLSPKQWYLKESSFREKMEWKKVNIPEAAALDDVNVTY